MNIFDIQDTDANLREEYFISRVLVSRNSIRFVSETLKIFSHFVKSIRLNDMWYTVFSFNL